MSIITMVLLSFVGLLHLYFLVLEMYLWTKPIGLKVFKMTKEDAESKKILALNQGLYNGFLAMGVFWSMFHSGPIFNRELAYFFLGCVVIAGIVGGMSVNKRIFFIQSGPAILSLISLIFS